MDIPEHLSHLQRDGKGRPVPYVNIVGWADDPDRLGIRFDRNVGAVATWFTDDLDGEPDLGRQSPQRQRECMLRRLCQVCARPVEPGVSMRAVFAPSTAAMIPWPTGGKDVVLGEPWLCPACAEFSVQVCPELIRRRRDEQLTTIEVEEYELTVSTGWLSGPYEYATQKNPVVMWVKAAVLVDDHSQHLHVDMWEPDPKPARPDLYVPHVVFPAPTRQPFYPPGVSL